MEYIKGMTWGWVGKRGTWNTESASDSMEKMKELGVNWTAIAFQGLQETAQSTSIKFNEDPLVSDEEVRWGIQKAKALGLKVVLKPVVNVKDGTWRAHINFFDLDVPCEPKWKDWFESYEAFILHYAKIAEEEKCEMFCIGCEMVQTDRKDAEWRELIRKVRMVYTGPITYNCDKYQEAQLTWWDAVDIISSSGYYPEDTWEYHEKRIKKVVEQWNKPFFFMETGCPSRPGSSKVPNDWDLNKGQLSMEEQDHFYKQMFQVFNDQGWFYGFMLWDWPAELYKKENAHLNDDYCVYGKPAFDRIQTFFNKK